jgi:phosphoglycerol transferase MdoB-like AlkP superfamily enzyme
MHYMLFLVVKALIAPVLLAVAALVERRWGAAVGGWLLGLPLTSGPVSFLLLAEHGPRFAEHAARGTLLGLVGAGVFVAGYSLGAAGWSWGRSLALGGIASLGVTFALSQVHLALGMTMVFAAVVLAIVALVAAAAVPQGAESVGAPKRRDLAVRMLFATTVVLGVSVASTLMGSQLSGMLTALPTITAVMAVTTHRSSGKDSARGLLRGTVAGLWGGAAFFGVVGLLVTVSTPGVTYLAAAAAAAVVAGVSGRIAVSKRLVLARQARLAPPR